MNGWLKTAAKIGLALGLMVALALGVSFALLRSNSGSQPRERDAAGPTLQQAEGSPQSMEHEGRRVAYALWRRLV